MDPGVDPLPQGLLAAKPLGVGQRLPFLHAQLPAKVPGGVVFQGRRESQVRGLALRVQPGGGLDPGRAGHRQVRREPGQRPFLFSLRGLPEGEAAGKVLRRGAERGVAVSGGKIDRLAGRPDLQQELWPERGQWQKGLKRGCAAAQRQQGTGRDAGLLQQEAGVQHHVGFCSPAAFQEVIQVFGELGPGVRLEAAAHIVVEAPGALLPREVGRGHAGERRRVHRARGAPEKIVEPEVDQPEERLVGRHERVVGRPVRQGLEGQLVQAHHGLSRIEVAFDDSRLHVLGRRSLRPEQDQVFVPVAGVSPVGDPEGAGQQAEHRVGPHAGRAPRLVRGRREIADLQLEIEFAVDARVSALRDRAEEKRDPEIAVLRTAQDQGHPGAHLHQQTLAAEAQPANRKNLLEGDHQERRDLL